MSFASSSSVVLLLVALLATSLSHANGQSCTPATCPEGPVVASFSSSDCSGTPTFYPYTFLTYDVCMVQGDHQSMKYETTDMSVTKSQFNNPTCTHGLVNETGSVETDYFYVCKPPTYAKRDQTMDSASANSFIVLPNVNASYPSPQSLTINPNYPSYDDSALRVSCEAVNNCTHNGVNATYWETDSINTCEATSSNAIFNISFEGTCYLAGNFYVAYRCVDEHTSGADYFIGNGCQHVFHTEAYRRVCTSTSSTTYYCMAAPYAPAPVTPYTPPTSPSATNPSATPSAAATIIPSSLFILSILALMF